MANYKKWTDAEKAFIKDNIAQHSDTELAIKLSQMTGENISTAMIRRQRRKFGISKPRGRRKKTVEVNNSVDTN
jgi:hypothetical protein